MLVAWNGSREAARALHDAWPLLTNAEQVDVVVVSPSEKEGDALLQRHLERHITKLRVTFDHGPDGSASDILRAHVERLEADTVVMGLYGRPRITEILLGGVSSDFLREPPAALFLSH